MVVFERRLCIDGCFDTPLVTTSANYGRQQEVLRDLDGDHVAAHGWAPGTLPIGTPQAVCAVAILAQEPVEGRC